jgi:hypothetical protein
MLHDNITTSISGTVTGGENGIAYLCGSDPDVSISVDIDGSGVYLFEDVEPGSYLVIVTDAGNTASNVALVNVAFGEEVTEDFASLPLGSSSGCPVV